MACLYLDAFSTLAHISTQECHSLFLGLSPRSPQFNRQLSSRVLNPKCRAIIHHKVRCKTVGFEVPNSPHSKSLTSSPSVSSRAALGLFPLPCSTTSCRRLALRTSLESLNLSPSIIFMSEPLSFKERWRPRWKHVKQARTGCRPVSSQFWKICTKVNLVRLQVCHTVLYFRLVVKKNRFHALISLWVFTFVFVGFCCKTYFWNSSTFLFSLFSFLLTLSVFPIFWFHKDREFNKKSFYLGEKQFQRKKTLVHPLEFCEIYLRERNGQSRAGNIAPSCPIG